MEDTEAETGYVRSSQRGPEVTEVSPPWSLLMVRLRLGP